MFIWSVVQFFLWWVGFFLSFLWEYTFHYCGFTLQKNRIGRLSSSGNRLGWFVKCSPLEDSTAIVNCLSNYFYFYFFFNIDPILPR